MAKEKPKGEKLDIDSIKSPRAAKKAINDLAKLAEEVAQDNQDLKKRIQYWKEQSEKDIKGAGKFNFKELKREVLDFQVQIFVERIVAAQSWEELESIVSDLSVFTKDIEKIKPELMIYFSCSPFVDYFDLKPLIKDSFYSSQGYLDKFNGPYKSGEGSSSIEIKVTERDLWEHVLPTIESISTDKRMDKGAFIDRLFGQWPLKQGIEPLNDSNIAKDYFEIAKTFYKKYPQARNLQKPLKYSAEKLISIYITEGNQGKAQEFLISLAKEDVDLLKAMKLDCREMGIDTWEVPTQEGDKKNWEIARVILGINAETIFNRWMEEAKQENIPLPRLSLGGKLDRESSEDFAARIKVYKETQTTLSSTSSWEESDLSREVQRSKELEELRGESIFNAWTATLTQEATDLFAYAAKDPQYQIDGVDYNFLKENAKLFVEELAVARYQSREMDSLLYLAQRNRSEKSKLVILIEESPDFITLLGKTASLGDFGILRLGELSKTLGKASLDHRLQSIDALQAYKKRKEAILQSAQQQVRSAQEKYDAKKEGFTSSEQQYLKWMQDYVEKDLPRILDALPFLLGEDKANVQRMSSRLLRVNTFPSIDIRPQGKGVGGTAYARRYELSDDLSTYEQFQNTSIHELIHVVIENPNPTSIFSYNLGEGITEFLTHNALKKSEIDSSGKQEKAYPQVYAFAELLDGLDPQCLAVFYTKEKIPTVSFNDLPKISVDGRPKTYIDGVKLNTPEKKYLCRVILDQLGPQYLTKEGSYLEQREAFDPINSIFKKIFNTEFMNKDYDGPMGVHYASVKKELNNVLENYRQ